MHKSQEVSKMLFFIGQLLPYIAAAIFLIGTCRRIAVWLRAPVPFELTLFPAAKTSSERAIAFGRELLLFDSLRRGDKQLWLCAWLLHVSLALIIAGHITGIYYLTKQFTIIGLSPQASSELSSLLGTISGILFIIVLIVLFYRRTAKAEVKRLSDPANYFELLLLFAVAATGMYMRVTSHPIELSAVRAYLGGLFTFHPSPIPKDWIFVSHFTLVNILLIYFPFSKLIHIAGFIVNRMIITRPPPVYPTPAGIKCGVSFKQRGRDED